jgi:voltage-gated potassium channel
MKRKIYELVEKGSHGSKINLIFDYFIIALIVLNVTAVAFYTVTTVSPGLLKGLKIFEIFTIITFTIEYLMRLYVSSITHPAKNKFNSAVKFILSPYGLIDLLAILPFYVPFIIKVDLRFLRMIRLIRFFRIFKISRYNSTLKLFVDVFKEKKAEIQMTFFIALLLIVVSAFLIYSVENPVQPEKFPDIFATLWWTIGSLTSLNFENIFPITIVGKAINLLMSALGIGLIALPTGIISAGFIEKIDKNKSNKAKEICPHCGKER